MQPSQRRYACPMRLAAAGFAVFAFAACGGLVAPGNGEPSGGPGSGAEVPGGSGSTGNATQSSADVGAGAANSGTGPDSAGDASGVVVMPPGAPAGLVGAPPPPLPPAPPVTGPPPNSGAPGAPGNSGTGTGATTSGSVGAGFGFGFTSNDGGVTGGGSCPVSSGPVTCEALPPQIDPTGQSAFSGNWPGCQYMVCFDQTCVSCTCMASGPQAIWVCGTAPSQGPPILQPPR